MRIFKSSRVARYRPEYRGKNAEPLPPKYQAVMGYPPDCKCPSRIAFVGENPGADEDQAGFPFVGRSGEELDRFLDTYGIEPDNCFITNIGRVYRVGNPDPTQDDINTWEPLLYEELNRAKPLWIGAVGRVSTRYFLGDVDMEAVHGVPFLVVLPWLDNGRGGRVVVVPIYHPAAGFHSTELQANIAYDFAQLDLTVRGKLVARQPELADRYPNPVYRDLTDEPADLGLIADSLAGGSDYEKLIVAIDTEGLPGNPWGLSYSVADGTAFVIRKVHHNATQLFYLYLMEGINAGRIHVVLHNSLHDLRVLRELGIPTPDGSFTDTMVLSYHLCVEPQGLKPLAFRHAGMEMDSYDEIISDAQDWIAVEYYELIESLCAEGVTYASPETSVWCSTVTISAPDKQPNIYVVEYDSLEEAEADMEVYRAEYGKRFKHTKLKRLVTKATVPTNVGPFRWIQPYTIRERDKATGQLKERTKTVMQIHQRIANALKGLREGKLSPADLRSRWNQTDDLIVDIVEAVIGPMREAGLDDVPLERAVRYAARDADATHRIYPLLRQMHTAMGLEYTSEIDHSIIPMVDRMQEVGMEVDVDYFKRLSTDLEQRMLIKQGEIKDRFGVWINPNSGDQVADLLFRSVEEGGYGLEASKKTRGTIDAETGEVKKRRGSTQDKVLEGLRSQHPIIPLILDYRGLNKAKTSFADVAIRNAKLEQGRWIVHCKFRVTRVSSGRLSATGPNLMAVMGGALGLEIRSGYTAGDGEFAAWDLNQIEMRVMASEANDAFLISMFLTDEDVHTGTADRMFKLGLKRPYNKRQVDKDKHRDPAKRTGFGVITGIQAPGLVDQMRLQGIIVSEDEAAQWIIDWLAACPAVPEYMQRCHREAMAYGYVRDWAGRIRYLPGIHSPFRHVRAEAGRQSHSHKIQAGAQAIMKLAMAKVWREVLPYWWTKGREIQPVLQVHDELILWMKGFTDDEKEELNGQIRACLFASAPPNFRIPLDAGNGFARNWAELEH